MSYSRILTSAAVVLALSSVPAYAQRGGGHAGRGGGGHAATAAPRGGGSPRAGTAVPRGPYGGPRGGYYGHYGYYRGYYGGYYPGYWASPWFGWGWGPYDYWGYPYAWGYPYPYYGYPYTYPPPYAYPPPAAYPPAGYAAPGQPPADQYGGYGQSGTVSAAPGAPAGSVSFNVTPPDAAVYVDGRYVGTAAQFGSQPLPVAAGRHRIELQAEGYRPMTFDVTVEAGKVTPYRAELQATR